MYIYYKIYDVAASILLIFSIARLLDNQFGQLLLVQVSAFGFAAAIGRNHGIYSLFACACAVTSIQFGSKANCVIEKIDRPRGLGVFWFSSCGCQC